VLNYKLSSKWGFIGVVIGLCAFLFNYNMVPVSLPGYKILAAPAMFTLSFFSEETYFVPKMILFLSGQFLGYFLLACIIQVIKKNSRLMGRYIFKATGCNPKYFTKGIKSRSVKSKGIFFSMQ